MHSKYVAQHNAVEGAKDIGKVWGNNGGELSRAVCGTEKERTRERTREKERESKTGGCSFGGSKGWGY